MTETEMPKRSKNELDSSERTEETSSKNIHVEGNRKRKKETTEGEKRKKHAKNNNVVDDDVQDDDLGDRRLKEVCTIDSKKAKNGKRNK